MVRPAFKVFRSYMKDGDEDRCLWPVDYRDGTLDTIRSMNKPFLCADGITRQTIWTRTLGRCFVEWNDGRATIRAADSGIDGSVHSSKSARKHA